MSTIPAKIDVNIIPGVVTAGGAALAIIGLALDDTTRIPIAPLGATKAFPDLTTVQDYFGTGSKQDTFAQKYFAGFIGRTAVPASLLFTQYPKAAVAAYLRGNGASLTLTAMQALTGSLTVIMDGYTHVISSISLSSYNSFSAAAAGIQAAFTDPTEASFTGQLGATFTGSQSGMTLTVASITGTINIGDVISGTGVAVGTTITAFGTGTGGNGTYTTSASGTASTAACVAASTVLDVTVNTDHGIAVGQTLAGSGVTGSPLIQSQISGTTGSVGLYRISGTAQQVASEAMTAIATAPVVTYDSLASSFLITSGITGAPSTAAYATGTLAAPLFLTLATGAVLSQGAAATTPAAFMNAVIAQNQNWVSFTTDFDPDGGSGNTQKIAFAAWNNSVPEQFMYVMWDEDITPTITSPAVASAGYIVNNLEYEGIAPIWEPTNLDHAAFLMGMVASIDFAATNGRITTKFRTQAGIVPGVTDEATAVNLSANGYNCVGAVATASQQFIYFRNNQISGQFKWIDSYINQIWLNSAFQTTLLSLLTGVGSIPYNPVGYSMIEAVLTGGADTPVQLPPASPVAAALNFGAIRPNVPLSALQAVEVNTAAGLKIDGILSTRGWYLQVLPPTAQVRAARGTPICNFWYTDGQSVQQITMASIEVE